MRPVLVCPDDLLEHMVAAAAFPGERPLYLVSRASLRTRLGRHGDRAVAGRVTDPAFLHEAPRGAADRWWWPPRPGSSAAWPPR